MPFYEPGLEDLVQRNRQAKRLEFVSRVEDAVAKCQVIFICVGTPPLDNGEADLSSVEIVARRISGMRRGYHLVIEKSTVPVQTGRRLQKHFAIYGSSPLFKCDVASNPEFLREGSGVEDFFHPDRIVVGVDSEKAAALLEEIYRPMLEQSFACPVHENCANRSRVPFVVTDINSAELIKHASNSFLAMKISFINMIADLCEAVGADVGKVAEAVGMDKRIGGSFLRPGVGFGGSCFPKDLQAFVRVGQDAGCDFTLLREVERINQSRIDLFVSKIKMSFGWCAENGSEFGDSHLNRARMMCVPPRLWRLFGDCLPKELWCGPTIPRRWKRLKRSSPKSSIAQTPTRRSRGRKLFWL